MSCVETASGASGAAVASASNAIMSFRELREAETIPQTAERCVRNATMGCTVAEDGSGWG